MKKDNPARMDRTQGPQTAVHYLSNLVPFPNELSIAPQHLSEYPPERLLPGLFALQQFVMSIYRAGVESPEALIPPIARRPKGLTDIEFTAYPRLLFALGLHGKPVESDGQILLLDWSPSPGLAGH